MPTADAIESGEVDVERVEANAADGTDGSYDLTDPVPAVAVGIVVAYVALVFVFAALAG